jgi:CRISPR-associated protein Csx10
MKAIEFDLVLEQPLLISQAISGGENTSLAMDYVPGSVVRGAIIANLIRKGQFHDVVKQNILYEPDILFLNAYPVYRNGNETKRMLPMPLSWRSEKSTLGNSNLTIFDYAREIPDTTTVSTLVNPPGLFFYPKGNTAQIHTMTPQKQQNVHIMSITRMAVKEKDNKVFTYEALSAGQTFKAVILLGSRELDPKDLGLEDDIILTLGRSKSANYGRCRVNNVKPVDEWSETEGFKAEKESDTFTITLLSPAIFHDQYGQPSLKPLIKDNNATWLEPRPSFVKTMLIGGYNRQWGMPIPQVVAAKAGSVYVYEGKIPTDLPVSLGERMKEGFGRYAINFFAGESWNRAKPEPGSGIILPDFGLTGGTQTRTPVPFTKSVLRAKLEVGLNQLYIGIEGPTVSKAQLSRLMNAAIECRRNQTLNHLKTFLQGLRENAKRQFANARVRYSTVEEEKPLLDWLTYFLEKPNEAPGLEERDFSRISVDDARMYVAELVEKLAKKTIKQSAKQKEAQND